ncbi:FtsQ-type POTRA domain-containing protein [Maribrevibacterium harenarium]|uniref:Cell division protein FtsQ n=1 Tax=Maribrevibacterium harenarium TaxID=2589817 RepID=A0A501WQB3_9GAMM|nr:cell division protein FtsQ/DivIB [Maribrevibacterium harenarium]TPE51973.1 FtsQ-type POTRA domain-containing protein [Maribrevibacterium harenarium]
MRIAALIGALLLILAGLLQGGSDEEVWLPIKQIKITGDLKYTNEAQLMTSYSSLLGSSMVTSAMATFAEVATTPEWVKSAQVRRVWPGTLEIQVTEHEPIARWNQNALLTSDGRVITPGGVTDLPLVALAGPDGTEKTVLDQFGLISQMLSPTQLRVHLLELENRGAWNITFTNGITVKLGRDEILERLQRFVAVYKSDLSGRIEQIVTVDARYPHGIAVRWQEVE